ncbi:MAG: TerB N-terminal domain-containing protein [Oscillospiraceae bacterium]|jgi:hypothetical protein|nr:TerB N-terminal domain-containing protein [Oscillospiraceae bacterium]
MNRSYQPIPIPDKERLGKEKTILLLKETVNRIIRGGGGGAAIGFDPGLFAQVEVPESARANAESESNTAHPQSIQAAAPTYNVRMLLAKMSSLRYYPGYAYDRTYNAKVFYRQAVFMKDFEDDYTETEAVTSYFRSYNGYLGMEYRQLRAYFTWRTKVRRGDIAAAPIQFAFLYIFEIINNIGVNSTQEGADTLTEFWKRFRALNKVNETLDSSVFRYLKDYYIYYLPERSFRDFAKKRGIMQYYPEIFAYGSGEEDSFELFAGFSRYKIRRSAFYSDQTLPIISKCFYFLLTRLRGSFAERQQSFEDFVFYVQPRKISWTPFQTALFYPTEPHRDVDVIISEHEAYFCRNNLWKCRAAFFADYGYSLIGYIMKAMESELRKILKFKYKISPREAAIDPELRRKIAEIGISLPGLIKQSVAEFYALYTRTEVRINRENLARIRKEALDTQDKLIVPDDAPVAAVPHSVTPAAVTSAPKSDIWIQLRETLTRTEIDALSVILRGGDLVSFAAELNVMPEVLIDGINQKAADNIGDTIIEFDGKASIYEDYTQKLTEAVRG